MFERSCNEHVLQRWTYYAKSFHAMIQSALHIHIHQLTLFVSKKEPNDLTQVLSGTSRKSPSKYHDPHWATLSLGC